MTPSEAQAAVLRIRGRLDRETADVLAHLLSRLTRLEKASKSKKKLETAAEASYEFVESLAQRLRCCATHADILNAVDLLLKAR